MSAHVLKVDSVIKEIGGQKKLSDIYLTCGTGEVVGVLGRNGCGKSTLLKIIFGTEDANDKSIRIDDKAYSHPFRNGDLIAYLPQHGFLPKNISIRKIIRIYADRDKREKILGDLRVTQYKKKHIAELSGGELRYLEILLLVNLDVKFILLDEPFSGIEPLYQDKVIELINEYRSNKGFIITDHAYRKIIEASDRIVLLANGKTMDILKAEDLEELNYVPRGTFGQKSPAIDLWDEFAADTPEIKFEIDNQTLKDLDLFDKGKRGLAFAIFNHVRTIGGGDMLERIFKTPTQNIKLLEDRRDAIRFFYDNGIELNITKQQMDNIEHYLASGIPLTKKNAFDATLYSARNKLKQTGNYYVITTAITNTINILRKLSGLGTDFGKKGTPYYLAAISFRIHEIVSASALREIVLSPEEKPITAIGFAKCDHFFRKEGKEKLRVILDMVYEFDVLEAAANAVRKYDLSFPQYSSSSNPKVELQGLFNPLLAKPVPNDFEIGDVNNLCFMTGANMSGKSTFMKSFALSVYLAHIGFPVPAKKMETTLFNGLITTINLSDNINMGYSHFYSEVRRVKEVAKKIKEKGKIVVIFDELFRGTNVKDAADASLLIVSALSKVKQCLFIISTHIVEIADELKMNETIFFNCFESRLEGDKPIYSYKIKNCIAKERVGMVIIKNEKIIEILEEVQKINANAGA